MARDSFTRSMDEILAGQESLRIWREMLDVLKRMTLELHRIADASQALSTGNLEKAAREAKGEDGAPRV